MHHTQPFEYALELARELYRQHPAGCCLHVVLDDGNTKDRFVAFCEQYAKEKGHAECRELARELAKLSLTDRKKLRRHLHGLW
jgi:hypothetical protein